MQRTLVASIVLIGPILLAQPSPGPKPGPADPASPSGASLYKAHCSSCHGADGKGGGVTGENLAMKPGDLTRLTQKSGGQFPEHRLRKMLGGGVEVRGHGSKSMPVWGSALDQGKPGSAETAARIDRVVEHVKSLQAKPPAKP